jgi:hypothetical protein
MRLHGYVAAAAALGTITLACSGRYDVGFEPMPGGSAGQGMAGTETSSSGKGATASAGGSSASGPSASAGAGAGDNAVSSRCGFAPEATQEVEPLVATATIVQRIGSFLDGVPAVAVGERPAEPSAAWAAELAEQILDSHVADGTEPAGLAAFLHAWLQLPGEPAEAALGWAARLAEPDATLSTLLAGETSEPHRIGILTEPEWLAAHTRITPRGKWMNERLFCNIVPPPPASVPDVGEPSDAVTNRERLEEATSAPACRACHTMLDGPGNSLEHFDELGQYRDQDAGQPVDSSGATVMPDYSFSDYDTLASQLAQSCQVAQCFSSALTGHATAVEFSLTDAELNHVANVFADSGFSIRELVKAIVSSPGFLR